MFVSLLSFSQKEQKVDAVFKKLEEKYGNNNEYAFSMSYKLYKGHNSGKLSEQYNAQLFHSSKGTYQKIKNTEFVSTSQFSIKINHDEKAIVVTNGAKQNFFKEYKNALKAASSYELSEKNGNYNINIFFFGPTNLPYYKLNLIVNKSNYELKEVNLYYSSETDFDPSFNTSEWAKPHLKILYTKGSMDQLDNSWFLKENYYKIKSGKLVLNDKYSGYSVINTLEQ
ncbi:MAG: hypothetical protein COA32_14990 [Fluviicola sp.]|nr:MAG: hypothetical protein COA32_14990 [Fluviicola sp.]